MQTTADSGAMRFGSGISGKGEVLMASWSLFWARWWGRKRDDSGNQVTWTASGPPLPAVRRISRWHMFKWAFARAWKFAKDQRVTLTRQQIRAFDRGLVVQFHGHVKDK